MKKTLFFCYTPFTGLGLYGGFRGNRWLRNRITIFKQFVIPSLLNQSDREFIHWISWREEERNNPHVIELQTWLLSIPNYRFIFTYGGVCFWDDKFSDEEASNKLFLSLQKNLPDLMNMITDYEEVIMLIVPSDDLYHRTTVQDIKTTFELIPDTQVASYQQGYLCNYNTKKVVEYNPTTNPPFFAIKFPRHIFSDPARHMRYTGPYKSHEYVGDKMKLTTMSERGYMVGTHGENISTHSNHPFGGSEVDDLIFEKFGIQYVTILKIPKSWRKALLRKLPFKWQKRLRYLWGERVYNWFYDFIRS